MQKSDCIIGVEHVSKFFGDKAVLNDVNLSVRKGEFVTILGTVRLRKNNTVAPHRRLQTASEGVITIAGKDITQTPPHKRPVNTVFQKYALFPHLNVFNNIAFGLKLKKIEVDYVKSNGEPAVAQIKLKDFLVDPATGRPDFSIAHKDYYSYHRSSDSTALPRVPTSADIPSSQLFSAVCQTQNAYAR